MSRAKKVAAVVVAIVVVAVLSGFLGLLPLYAQLYRETVTLTAFGRTTTVTVTMQRIECVMKTETITAWIHYFQDTTVTVIGNQTVTILRTETVTDVGTTTLTFPWPRTTDIFSTKPS